MRPLDIAGMANLLSDFGQQLEIALAANKELREEIERLKSERGEEGEKPLTEE